MKTVERDDLTHTIYYTFISKIRQKFKNNLVVKKISQMSDVIVNACMRFENFPIKTVREEAFLRFLYNTTLFQNFKNSPKIQK